MDDMSGIMKSIIKSAEAANKPEEGDYYDEDGLPSCVETATHAGRLK